MNSRRYRQAITLLNILMRFMIGYTVVCLALRVVVPDSSLVYKSLILLPAPFLSAWFTERTKHIWSFALLHLTLAILVIPAEGTYVRIVYGLYLFILTAAAFRKKLRKTEPPYRNTPIGFLAFFFVASLYSDYLADSMWKTVFFAIAVSYILFYWVNMYLINFVSSFEVHPVSSVISFRMIQDTSHRLIFIFCLFCTGAMLAFSRIPLAGLGNVLLWLLRKFFSLFQNNNPSQSDASLPNAAPDIARPSDLPQNNGQTPAIIMLILNLLRDALIVAAVAGGIALLIYGLYKCYRLFYESKDSRAMNKTEFLSPFEKMELPRKDRRSSYGSRFARLFGRSGNERIRRYFYKAIIKHAGSSKLPGSLTPSELAKYAVGGEKDGKLPEDEKSRKLAALYEKARYSDEECGKEEVQSVREILK